MAGCWNGMIFEVLFQPKSFCASRLKASCPFVGVIEDEATLCPRKESFPSEAFTCHSLNKLFLCVPILQGSFRSHGDKSTLHQCFCCSSNGLNCLPCLFWEANISQAQQQPPAAGGDADAPAFQLISCLPCNKQQALTHKPCPAPSTQPCERDRSRVQPF